MNADELPLEPIEEDVVKFFDSMLEKVEDGDQAVVLLESTALAIAAFLGVKFEKPFNIRNARAFCRSVMKYVEVGIPK